MGELSKRFYDPEIIDQAVQMQYLDYHKYLADVYTLPQYIQILKISAWASQNRRA